MRLSSLGSIPQCRFSSSRPVPASASEAPPARVEALASAVISEDNLEALTDWSRPVEGSVRSAPTLLNNGSAAVATTAGRLYLFGPDGAPRWDKRLDGPIHDSPVRLPDGGLVVATEKGHVYCFEPDGRERWKRAMQKTQDESDHHRFGSGVKVTTTYSLKLVGRPFAAPDGRVFVGTAGGVHIFRPDGKHEIAPGTERLGDLLTPYGTHGGHLFVAHEAVGLKRLDHSGRPLWTYPSQEKLLGPVTQAPDGTSYFCLHEVSPLLSVLPAHMRGQIMGQVPTSLVAVGANGRELWRREVRGGSGHAPLLGSDGKLYLGTAGGVLYAFDPASGHEEWSQDTGKSIASAPGLAADGTVFAPSGDSHLYAYTPQGRVHWRYARPGWGAATPALSADGRLLVGGEGSVRCLKSQNLSAAIAAAPSIRAGESVVTVGGVRVKVRRPSNGA